MFKYKFLLFFLIFLFPISTYAKTRIILDPGHGGEDSGAMSYNNKVKEKDINLKIGLALKKELEKEYKDIEVKMTRDKDKKVELEERVEMGKDYDFVISLHNNAVAEKGTYNDGCCVLVASGNFKKDLSEESQKMGANILHELSELGLNDRGLLVRYADDGSKYENGKKMDHYKIIRYGVLKNVPSVLIEHSFIDNKEEFNKYLSDDDKIKALAKADGKGIARYFGLTEKESGKKLKPIENNEVVVSYLDNDDWTKAKNENKTFYQTTGEETEETTEEETEEMIEEETEEEDTLSEEGEDVSLETATEATTENNTQVTTEIKVIGPANKEEITGDKIETSDLNEISEDSVSIKKFIITGIIVILFLSSVFIFVVIRQRRKY